MVAYSPPIAKNEKSALRRRMRLLLAELTPAQLAAPAAMLLTSPLWRNAASVALYAPLPGEVDAAPLLEHAWQMGKSVYLPKITDQKSRRMEFLPCAAWNDLAPGPFGLREPQSGEAAAIVDLLLIPALAYDQRGQRLGHGAGYYDRFLAARPHFARFRAGLCHSSQLLPRLPADPWDMAAQALATEKGIMCL